MSLPCVFLMGPTASGKTDLAIEMVQRWPFEIISVDSALIYRQMDIGSAKPSAEELAKAPHRLLDFLDPAETYSAADFREDALREIKAIHAQGKIPLLVGGTIMYFRALEFGLAELPEADADVRAALEAEAAEKGWEVLHQRLAMVDPAAAKRIHPNDPQRLQRALEVYQLTGKPLSDFQVQKTSCFPYPLLRLALMPKNRAWLHERIARRFQHMLDSGLLEEVEALKRRGDLHLGLPSMRAVGYRQVWQYLEGEIERSELADKGIVATRRLAKRQMTWLRHYEDVHYFDSECLQQADLAERVQTFLRPRMLV